MGSYIYASATGDTGTWVEQVSFTAIVDLNAYGAKELATTTAAGGWISAGTKNFVSGPGVYNSFDGSTWSDMGPIPYPNALGNYYEISSMAFFNPSGPEDDTLFVAVQNAVDGAEIWKNYASGGSWTQVFDFPSYTTGRINDIVEFNNKLYACTNTALIYESVDGNNWTMNVPADTGFNDSGIYGFTAMAVFQNRLYVAAINSTTGTQIWNTIDGLTWSPVNIDGFTNGSNMNEITDMMVANGKLWLSAYSWTSGGALMPIDLENRGGFYYTYIYSSSDGSTFTNLNNDGFGGVNRSGNLGYFQNFVYQGSDNTGWGNGELWRLCQAPSISISPLSANGCLGNPTWFNDTLYAANLNEWYVNDTLLYSGVGGFYYTPTYLGTHVIKLIGRNGTCVDSISTTITVYPNPTSSPTSIQAYCYGTMVTLYDTISGGTAPYTVNWFNEVSFSAVGASIVLEALTNFDVYANVTDANGCSSGNVSSGYTVVASTDLVGHVSYSGGNVTNGSVVAYKYIPAYTYFDTVAVTTLNASGDYIFTSLNGNDYLIKVFADTLTYPTLNPTYYGNEWAWDSATVYVHGCSLIDTANIVMIEEIGIGTGAGMLTGTIIEGVGFGSALMVNNGFMRLPGEPIPGVDVKLGKNPGGAMVTSGTTNTAGVYTFAGVDVNVPGEYYTVYVDIPGLGRDSSYSVTVTATTNQFYFLDYYVDSTTIYIGPTSGVGISNPNVAEENKFGVYPNPSNGNSSIEYSLLNDANVSLTIYNVLGLKTSTLVNKNQTAGMYEYSTRDLNLTSGIYFITFTTDEKTITQRLIITK